MTDKIVCSSEPVTLVGGAPAPVSLLSRLQSHAPRAVAADGGAAHVLNMGWLPEKVIGDMDSLSKTHCAALDADVIVHVSEQETTDFEKCLLRIAAPLVLAAGFRGGRLDHDLAALHGVVRFAAQRCVLVSETDLVFLCPPALTLDLPEGTPLSLFPMGAVTGQAAGLQWSFKALDFAPGARIGTSNRVTGPVKLRMSAPAMLCILPMTDLERLITQLAEQRHATWPVRA